MTAKNKMSTLGGLQKHPMSGLGQRVGQKGGHFKNEKAFVYRGFSEGGHLLGQDSGHCRNTGRVDKCI